jgi:hypothetical protein
VAVTVCVPRANVVFCTGSEGTAVTTTWLLKRAPASGEVMDTESGTFSTKAWMAVLTAPLVPALFTACTTKL